MEIDERRLYERAYKARGSLHTGYLQGEVSAIRGLCERAWTDEHRAIFLACSKILSTRRLGGT